MNPDEIDLDALTRDEKSALVYAETCLVDYGGLLEGIRMNEHDIAAFNRFQTEGLLTWGRVPGAMIGTFARKVTHWITFNDGAWILAHRLRRARAGRSTPSRQAVDAYLDERETA